MEPLIFQKLKSERPSEKQQAFFLSTAKHTAYGGARGGGKSWAVRRKCILLGMRYDGLKILLLRRTLPELRENHILPMMEELYGYADYHETQRAFVFPNGSRIKMGYCDAESDVYQYQGQEYDVIAMEEATHFTERQRMFLTTANRGTRADFAPRMYYTANPGGVGHGWFKRLFIDGMYREGERAEDYAFIPANVYDNEVLMQKDPGYVRTLEALPEDRRRAYLNGDWDVFAGQYFPEFDRRLHVVEPFVIPKAWRRYLTLDYGLDMLAAYWIAVDLQGFAYVYRELYEKDLIISEAAEKLLAMTGEEALCRILAPPDLWNRRQDSGKSAAALFYERGLRLSRAGNDRVQGWYALKEWLKPCRDEWGRPAAKLRIFPNCKNLIRTLPQLCHDEKNPNDAAQSPHELTHAPDALRYFVSGRPQETARPDRRPKFAFDSLRPREPEGALGLLQRQEVF